MAQSLANILVHLIFSTKNRLPLIRPEVEHELHAYLAAVCREMDCPALDAGGTEDHVHILLSLSRTVTLSSLVEEVKKRSSKWIKTKGEAFAEFAWQAGYGAFSIGQSGVGRVKQYIAKQKEHHRKVSFQDELRAFLRRYQVEFDERYLWD
ncbi:MAG: IS200/IS605 family transposase [Candidatus Brocadiae bacterium]|nr:IS200/IS605 family transposase [Candidatus Brocadiia bacterium]